MRINRDELHRRAILDLTNRARGGIVIYLLIWLTIALPKDVHTRFPEFFLINTVILTLIFLSRLTHYLCHKRIELRISRLWLVGSVLAGSVHWGMMCSWAMLNPAYENLFFYLGASAVVIGIAGTTALSIDRQIRLIFPFSVLGPTLVALLIRGQHEDLVGATMIAFALVYVYFTSRTASLDYWQAIKNHALAEHRALLMEKLSVTDPLTRLKNRSYFDKRFREEWKRGDRQGAPLSILMLDLDHFKEINDTYGHIFGDYCLQQVADTLQASIPRETDLVARYGGEEFVVLLPDTSAAVTNVVGEKLCDAISAIELSHNGEQIRLTCSVGGATAFPDYHDSRESLLRQADDALYQAKQSGRNQYQVNLDRPVTPAKSASG